MSFFSQQTRVIEIDSQNSVTVRKLTYEQQQAVMSASMTFKLSMQTGQAAQMTTGELDPFRLKREELIASIVSWEGEGFEGRPVTRENIGALPPDIIAIIQAGVDELNGGLSADEKKASIVTTNTA
jgi:hypothetical protein